jgi:hypothetical protein
MKTLTSLSLIMLILSVPGAARCAESAAPAAMPSTEAAPPPLVESPAPEGPLSSPTLSPSWLLRGSVGFTLDPDTFLMGLEGDYSLTKELFLGPLVQIGVSDDHVIVAPTANLRYEFALPEKPKELKNLKPFLQVGMGFVYMHKDQKHHDRDDVGFLINPGFGVDYYLTDKFALGTNMLFNVVPGDVLDQHFFFSWQVLTATYKF